MGLPLTMICASYDRNRALLDGTVKPRGIDLKIHVTGKGPGPRQSLGGGFDVCEFYAGLAMADLAHRSLGLTAIPIFVKRMFRHSYIYINRRAGIKTPSDLNGRRIGIQSWFTTTALWARGILAEEYGVDLSSVTWVAEKPETYVPWEQPSWLKLSLVEPGQQLHEMLSTGAIDAAITTSTWAPGGHPDIDFLFPNYPEVERDYYRRTGFFPIMHTLVVKTDVLEREPWVAMSLFDAWQEAKLHCYRWLEWQRVHQTSMWYRALWEEERAAAGGPDIYPWGFARCRAEVDKMLTYVFEQGLAPRKFAPEDLFHASTLAT